MIRPIALSEAHMECRSLGETLPVMTDLMAFEEVARAPGQATVKHPNTDWLLTIHEGAEGFPDRPTHHHFGVRVESKPEVDAAWEYLNVHKDEYALRHLVPQVHRHGSYSIHFQEPGTNYWEIECYEDVLRKDSGGERLGAVRSRHWDEPLPSSRFPGRGYVPQAFTHGTLGCADADSYGRFAEEVLGFEVHKAYATVRYLKHPATKYFIVCLQVDQPSTFSPNFRFTLNLESPEAVEQAHAQFAGLKGNGGVSELRPIETEGQRASFLVRDTDGNWWEYAA